MLFACLVALVALATPSAALALSPGCEAVNMFGGIFTIEAFGTGTAKMTTPGGQPIANGERVTYSWSGNTKGGYVSIVQTQNGAAQFAPYSVLESTATSGSGSFIVSNASANDYIRLSFEETAPATGNPDKPSARDSIIALSVSCSAPAPTIMGLSQVAGPTAGGNTVNITGSGFTGASAVKFGAQDAVGYVVVNDTQIAASAPANGPGTYNVTVTSANGTSTTSSWTQYTYVAAPTVTAVSPAAGPTGGGTTVVITGTGFSAAPGTGAVKFGATNATYTINSNTQITATAPANAAGTYDITVTTPGGTSATSASDQYTYIAAPTVTAVAPTAGPTSGGSTVVITGTNLSNATAVFFGGTAATGYTINSSTQIIATAPASAPGTVNVRVTTPGGASATSISNQYTYYGDIVLSPPFGLLARGMPGAAYSQTISSTGGVAPISYAVTADALPPGLTLSASGTITGTPTATGVFAFDITATDSSGDGNQASGRYNIVVDPPMILIDASLPTGAVGAPYSRTLSGRDGTAPYSYVVIVGSLPSGISLSEDGELSGTATAAGTYHFVVKATDSTTGDGPYTGTASFSLTMGAPTIAVGPTTLPNGQIGVTYNQMATASGGTAGYEFAVTSGALPAGLTLASNGAITGTPTQSGSFNFTVTVTDSSTGTGAPFTGSRAYSMSVLAPSLTMDPSSLNGMTVGSPFAATITAGGGTAPWAYFMYGGTSLPPGLTLSSSGEIAGTPTQAGSFSFTIAATESSTGSGPYTVARAYNVTVVLPSAPTAGAVSDTVAYNANGHVITPALSGNAATSIAVASAPSHGTLTINGLTFVYTPAPGYFGPDSFTYTASNGGGTSTPATVTLTVAAPPAPTAGAVSDTVAYNADGHVITPALSGNAATSIAVASTPSHGTVTISGLTFVYTPATDYFGPDNFTYTASNAGGTSTPATVTLTVAAPPAPVVTPPGDPVVVPPSQGGGSISVNLGAVSQGVIDGFRITVGSVHGTAELVQGGQANAASARSAASPSAAGDVRLVYSPAANFMGTDTVTVVAYGPGGDSVPVTFTFHVAGKAPDLTASVASDAVVTLSPTTGLVGGPFNALRITRAPAFGTATVDGLDISFVPGAANGGSTSLDYVIDLPFGASAAGRIDLTSSLVPPAQALTATTLQGAPVTVRISDAPGGPFTGAAVVSINPTDAGTAAVANTGANWDLTFTPADAFSGQAVVTFSLSNAAGTSNGTLTVTVEARPDPSQDVEVRGVATAQVTSARRFADAQLNNFQRRLQALHDGSNVSSNGLSLNLGSGGQSDLDNDPRTALRRALGGRNQIDPGVTDDRSREMLGLDLWAGRNGGANASDVSTDRLGAAAAPGGGREGGSNLGFWTAGSVDWGRQDADGQRDYRFTTQGVTAGLDVRVNDRLIFGGGLGYGEDKTKIGDNGSVSNGSALTGALYASWRPAEAFYVDGVIGYADLDFDARRWVTGLAGQPDGYAASERSGDVRFVSAAFGRLLRGGGMTTDIYARVDAREIRLDGFTETGGGHAALVWDDVEQSSLSANLGASWRWAVETRRLGRITPSARLEWSHELEDIGAQGVRYADWAASPTYLVPLDAWSRNAINVDLGAEWSLTDRLMLGLGYRGALGDASTSHGAEVRFKYGW
jgi:uncharacterized protein with beta-barrel porin domain